MEDQTATELVQTPQTPEGFVGDLTFKRTQEINDLIARRAYELFESRGFAHGHDLEDWLRAESEILLNVPVDITETETEVTIHAEVPGFSEKDLGVQAAPRSLCITGKRQEAEEQREGKTVYSERYSGQIFRVLPLPSQIDPDSVNATLSGSILEIKVLKFGMGKKIPVFAKAASA